MSDELDEVWSLYADDGSQSLDIVEETLLGLEKTPTDAEAVAALFRAMHTFKGNARVLGLAVVESRAHRAEDLIGLVRDEGVAFDAEMLGLLLEVTDALRGMLDGTVASRQDIDPAPTAELFERMKDKFERCKGGAAEDKEMTEAIVFEPSPKRRLADDPMYREIFSGMASDVLREMRQAMEEFDAGPERVTGQVMAAAERLRFAAEQIGMRDWHADLADLLATTAPSRGQLENTLRRLVARLDGDFGDSGSAAAPSPEVAEDPIWEFFDALAPCLERLSEIREQFAAPVIGQAGLETLVEEICSLAAPLGFVRLAEAARCFPRATGQDAFRSAEFHFYEELAAIEAVAPANSNAGRLRPSVILRNWCGELVFDNLLTLHGVLEQLHRPEDVAAHCPRLNEMMRFVYHACLHNDLETAAHLCMSLVDLFSRVQAGDMAPDPILLHIARNFVATMELVFDAAGAGKIPDMEAVEQLFQAAASATFVVGGTLPSSVIEARLSLPKAFHKVLTPESVETASAALQAGHRFYIVRADLNRDEAVASNFLAWFEAGAAQVISNVTVFMGDATLFDFLIATSLSEMEVAEALKMLDPQGRALTLERTLTDRGEADAVPAQRRETADAMKTAAPQETMSADMLEAIGEVITGQAMVRHMLVELAEDDLAGALEKELDQAGGQWHLARTSVRRRLGGLQEKIDRMLQIEGQLSGRLDRLQEEAIAIRTKPAALLLKPTAAFVETLGRQHGRSVEVATIGDEVSLDSSTLDHLKAPLRALAGFAACQSVEARDQRLAAGKPETARLRLGLNRCDDHIVVTIEDDGAGIDRQRVAQRAARFGWPDEPGTINAVLHPGYGRVTNDEAAEGGVDFGEILAALKAHGGDLRVANLPSGGLRSQITLPLAMVVLDGMVVRVGHVMYVIPVDAIQRIVHSGPDELVRISADDGRYMLRLAEGVFPVQFLMKSGDEDDGDPFAGLAANDDDGHPRKRLFVVTGKDQRRVALSVDELVGQQLVMVRPLQGYLSGIRGATGCALLGSGGVGMVLDMGYVLDQA